MSWIDQRPDDAMDGAFTAVAPGPVTSVEPLVFREAMSRLGAAVHVVTTAGAAGKSGFTATAVCSVSDSAGDATRLPQSPQQLSARARAKRRVLRQHASAPAKKSLPICSPAKAACICMSVFRRANGSR